MLLTLNDQPEEGKSLIGTAYEYVGTSGFNADLSILVDPLSIVMCLVVTGVSFLIHLYSVSYMTKDPGFTRFFAYLNFFVFSMLLLVLAANFVLLIVGWAFVGAASYLLISFWYRRATATAAGMKAFVINVVGDIGLVIGAFLLFDKTGALDYPGVFLRAPDVFSTNEPQLVIACLLLLVGAFAKSAQLPLHTWLPDAMEGPTPVSALIHAATMVTAGVYLIARCHPLFELAPTAADVGAVIGCATLIFAASIAHGPDRPQARDRVLHDVADRLHGHGRLGGRLRRGHLPPDDARLLQGAAVHGRRLGHRRHGRRAVDGPDGRLQEGDAVHLRHVPDRRARAGRLPADVRLLLQGRDPVLHAQPRRRVRGAGRGRATSPRC